MSSCAYRLSIAAVWPGRDGPAKGVGGRDVDAGIARLRGIGVVRDGRAGEDIVRDAEVIGAAGLTSSTSEPNRPFSSSS